MTNSTEARLTRLERKTDHLLQRRRVITARLWIAVAVLTITQAAIALFGAREASNIYLEMGAIEPVLIEVTCTPVIERKDGSPPICAGTGEWVAWGPQVPESERF